MWFMTLNTSDKKYGQKIICKKSCFLRNPTSYRYIIYIRIKWKEIHRACLHPIANHKVVLFLCYALIRQIYRPEWSKSSIFIVLGVDGMRIWLAFNTYYKKDFKITGKKSFKNLKFPKYLQDIILINNYEKNYW